MSKHTIERIGKTTGRWPKYELIVDSVNLGWVKRTIEQGCDRLAGNQRYDGWAIDGLVKSTREEAEQELIDRHVRWGQLKA